jgi:hypothetical protein
LMTNVGAEHRRADIYIGEPVDNATYRNLWLEFVLFKAAVY